MGVLRLAAVLAAGWLFTPLAVQAQALHDPAICATENGFVEVATAWVMAWDAARLSGQLQDPLLTDLAVWFTQMQNWMIETDEVEATCLALIEVRKQHGF